MAKYKLLLPKMGESVAEATIIKWLKNPGDQIEADEAVLEIATDKVDSEVPSPVAGRLVEKLCAEDDVVQVGAIVAIIETGEDESDAEPVITEKTVENAEPVAPAQSEIHTVIPEAEHPLHEIASETSIPGIDQLNKTVEQQPAHGENGNGTLRFYSPLVRSIAQQEGIAAAELERIPGTGADGRLTKDDLLNYLQNRYKQTTATEQQQPADEVAVVTPAPEPVAANTQQAPLTEQTISAQPESKTEQKTEQPPIAEAAPKASPSLSGGDEIIEMDRMRRLIADHMVMSKQTSPHVTSFVEADVTNIVKWRDRIKSAFEKREGEKITYTPIFIEAVVKAIKDMPMINVSVDGTKIIKKKDINIGMATALPSGNLIVPVIKKAEELNLLGLTKAVNDLANRARNGKLQPDDVKDGTFTITNVGTFGNVMGTPIINQPQVAILAVGAIKKKPAVIETPQGDMIGIRHMMFLSLSYDHRVVDGMLGGSFLRRVADYLEQWDDSREG